VSGTPTYFANGVKMGEVAEWNEEEWITFISKFVTPTEN